MKQTTPTSRADVRHLASRQVMALSAQFLIGMALALIGQPSQTTGAAHTASEVLLGLHILVAAGLIAAAARIIRIARGSDRQQQLAYGAAAAIVLTVGTGILTVITKNNWLSYAMAAGFITSLLIYVSLLVQATSVAGRSQEAATHHGKSTVSASE
jgi:heme A synthase